MKGHGYSNDLLEECIRDAKAQGKKGICILCAKGRKRKCDPFQRRKNTRNQNARRLDGRFMKKTKIIRFSQTILPGS